MQVKKTILKKMWKWIEMKYPILYKGIILPTNLWKLSFPLHQLRRGYITRCKRFQFDLSEFYLHKTPFTPNVLSEISGRKRNIELMKED